MSALACLPVTPCFQLLKQRPAARIRRFQRRNQARHPITATEIVHPAQEPSGGLVMRPPGMPLQVVVDSCRIEFDQLSKQASPRFTIASSMCPSKPDTGCSWSMSVMGGGLRQAGSVASYSDLLSRAWLVAMAAALPAGYRLTSRHRRMVARPTAMKSPACMLTG